MRSALLLITGSLLVAACGPSTRGDGNGIADAPPADAPCNTTVSGTVYAPNGTLPLYNVTVYVPQTTPGPFTDGVTCAKCSTDLPGGVVTKVQSDAEGKFKLENVPPGTDVPVVITTGKWRRQLTVPYVAQCVDNPVQPGTFRLPRNKAEGDIPRIAMVAGGCDALACILSKLGIDASEFGTSSTDAKRVTFFNAHGGNAPGQVNTTSPVTNYANANLWSNLSELMKYDMVLNTCECNEYPTEKTAPDVLRQYADMGGRVFGSHFHYIWQKSLITPWRGTANWDGPFPTSTLNPERVDVSHPDGMALAKWLTTVNASTTPGQITLGEKIPNAGPVNAPTTRWLYSQDEQVTHYLSFKTPVGVPQEQQCGKVVYTGLHVATGTVNQTFPSGCTSALTNDEKALVFLLFDLGSCVDVIF